jgi:hypothetical protein
MVDVWLGEWLGEEMIIVNLIFDGYVSVHLLYILSDFMSTQTGTVEFL